MESNYDANLDHLFDYPVPSFDVQEDEIDQALSLFSEPVESFEQESGKRQKLSSHEEKDDAFLVESQGTLQKNLYQERATPPAFESEDDDIDTLPLSNDNSMPAPSYDATESLIARKMSNLSMKEREEVYFDIHGVADVINEGTEFLDQNLARMQAELEKLDSKSKKAYDMARTINPSYVDNQDLRVRFLRAERFDAKKSAIRYAKFYDLKLEIFGPEKIDKDITQDDLGSEALDALYCGLTQILPRRDNAGRLVFFWRANQQSRYSIETLMRRVFYTSMIISDDVETQRQGIVGIMHTLNQQRESQGSKAAGVIKAISGMASALPVAIYSIHFCIENYMWVPVLSVAQISSHLFLQLRIKAHFGCHSECMYKLQTFGIPADTIPIDEKGELSVAYHTTFLKKRRAQEQERRQQRNNQKDTSGPDSSALSSEKTTTTQQRITVPTNCDILLGRGKGYFTHVGNVRYRNIIEEHKDRYNFAGKDERQSVSEDIIALIKGYGGRFLKDDDGVWVQIDDKTARVKVSHSFRALRSSKKGKGGDAASAPTMKRMRRD